MALHQPVLTNEVIETLNPKKGEVLVDCTVGSGGHATAILPLLGEKGRYVGIDQDPTALATVRGRLGELKQLTLIEGNFRNIKSLLEENEVKEPDIVLADLGWRIEQFDGSSGLPRGFSFQSDEPLIMTFGDPDNYPFTADDIVNEWDEEDIANVIYAYGEERFSRRIAKAIVERRESEWFASAKDLAEVIENALPRRKPGRKAVHPATKTFQALRIAVNDEFDAIESLIADSFELLKPGGRLGIISFHSLEDRIVKVHFKNLARDHKGVLVHKKPLTAGAKELAENPRARSAKLRTIEKI